MKANLCKSYQEKVCSYMKYASCLKTRTEIVILRSIIFWTNIRPEWFLQLVILFFHCQNHV